jgi:hypothetical protein
MNELSTSVFCKAEDGKDSLVLLLKNEIMHFFAYKSAARRKKYCKWARQVSKLFLQ